MRSELLLDTLEQVIWARGGPTGVIHHSDGGSQYLSIRYTDRLAEAGFEPSVGSIGDSCNNAMAESVIGFSKTPKSSITLGRKNTLSRSSTPR